MGIQINGQTDTITATDGNFTIQGASGNLTGDLVGNVTGNLTGTASTATAAATAYGISGSPTLSGISSVSTTNLTVNGNAYPSAGPLSNRNRIINGDMRIDQRNGGASVNVTGNVYTLDRWNCGGVNDGVLALQSVSDAPTGFTNSMKFTVSTADSSLGATQYARLLQKIEGYNVSDFAGGTASPATITLSFWVKSSVTGTYGGMISSGDETRVYVFQYVVNAANTWEYKSVTLTLPTTGTWATDNTSGMRLVFSLGTGSSYINTANTWLTSYAQQASGNVNLIGTLNATWQVTGVQLEVGTVATPFEHRSYGDELARCQRYYYRLYADSGRTFAVGYNQNTTATRNIIHFPVTMRSAPTALEQIGTASNYRVLIGTTVIACSAVPTLNSTTTNTGEVQATVSSGLTAGQGNCLESNVNGTYLGFTAEL